MNRKISIFVIIAIFLTAIMPFNINMSAIAAEGEYRNLLASGETAMSFTSAAPASKFPSVNTTLRDGKTSTTDWIRGLVITTTKDLAIDKLILNSDRNKVDSKTLVIDVSYDNDGDGSAEAVSLGNMTTESAKATFVYKLELDEPVIVSAGGTITVTMNTTSSSVKCDTVELWGSEVQPAKAESISLSDGTPLSPSFNPDVTEYTAEVRSEELPPVIASVSDGFSVNTVQATEDNPIATVTVSRPGYADMIYTIEYIQLDKIAELKSITIGGEPIEGFEPDKFEYVHTISEGDIKIFPEVGAIGLSSTTDINITQPKAYENIATIVATSADGETQLTYTVKILGNIARGKTGAHSSAYSGCTADMAADGDLTTYFNASANADVQWMYLDLEGKSKIETIYTCVRNTFNNNYFNSIQYSDDGYTWNTLVKDTHFTMRRDEAIITTAGGTVKDGIEYVFTTPLEARFIKITSTSYKGKIVIYEVEIYGISEPVLSSNNYLKSLTLSQGVLSPAFSKYETNYTVDIATDDPIPEITAEPVESTSSYEITSDGMTSTATVTVSAENGSTRKYNILFKRPDNPAKDASLKSLTTNALISPEFNSDIFVYSLILPEGDALELSASPKQTDADIDIIEPTADSAGTITVRSADGTAQRVYTLTLIRKSADLSSLTVDGKTIAFDPDVTEYKIILQPGESIPDVNASLADETSSITTTDADDKSLKTIISVTTSGNEATKVYTVSFEYAQNLEDAYKLATAAVADITASNSSTADSFLNAAKGVVTNSSIIVSWDKAFSLSKATSSEDGLITGVISLELNNEKVYININKSIPATGGGSGGSSGFGGGGVSYSPSIPNVGGGTGGSVGAVQVHPAQEQAPAMSRTLP